VTPFLCGSHFRDKEIEVSFSRVTNDVGGGARIGSSNASLQRVSLS
jgi:hypothetical protein